MAPGSIKNLHNSGVSSRFDPMISILHDEETE
jgi:hypothetical protein